MDTGFTFAFEKKKPQAAPAKSGVFTAPISEKVTLLPPPLPNPKP